METWEWTVEKKKVNYIFQIPHPCLELFVVQWVRGGMEGGMKGKQWGAQRTGGRLEPSRIASAWRKQRLLSPGFWPFIWRLYEKASLRLNSSEPSRLQHAAFVWKHAQKCRSGARHTQWLLLFTPRSAKGPSPRATNRRSIKLGMKGSFCVCACAFSPLRSEWAWLPAPLQPLKMLELLIDVFPHSALPQLPASGFLSFFSSSSSLSFNSPSCAALVSFGLGSGSSVCIFFV